MQKYWPLLLISTQASNFAEDVAYLLSFNMATRERKCITCNSPIELGYLFCPICGNSVVSVNSVTSSCSSGQTRRSESKGFSLESFEKFKRQKESQRSSFFVRKKGGKSSSKEEKEVVIYIGRLHLLSAQGGLRTLENPGGGMIRII